MHGNKKQSNKAQMTSVTDNVIKNSWWKMCIVSCVDRQMQLAIWKWRHGSWG